MSVRPRKRTLFWILTVLAILVAAAVIVPALVNGKMTAETEKARELIKDPDENLASLRTKGERINRSVGIIVPDIPYLSSSQYRLTKSNVLALIEEARAVLKEARRDYADIFDLNSVDEYIEYAKVKLGIVRLDFEQLDVAEGFLDFITGALAERDAGKPLDSQGVADATNVTIGRMKELGSRVEGLTAKAARMKKERGL